MHKSRTFKAMGVLVAGGALALAGCASSDPGGSTGSSGDAGGGATAASGDPIVVAALSGLTFFPEAPEAVQAAFDD